MTDATHSCGPWTICHACINQRISESEEQRRRIAELEDQLRLANIDNANATAECNHLSNQVDYLCLVLRKCQYDYENNSFAKSTRLAINNALRDKT